MSVWVYDPATDAVVQTWRTDLLEDYEPRGFCRTGRYAVAATEHRAHVTDGRLFVFDMALMAHVATIPIDGHVDAGVIIPVGEKDVIGLTGTYAYRRTVDTGAIVWETTLPAAAFHTMAVYDRQAQIGADGYIYLFCGVAIYRIWPGDGTLEHVLDYAAVGAIRWINSKAYLTNAYTLKRLDNLSPISPLVTNRIVATQYARSITATRRSTPIVAKRYNRSIRA